MKCNQNQLLSEVIHTDFLLSHQSDFFPSSTKTPEECPSSFRPLRGSDALLHFSRNLRNPLFQEKFQKICENPTENWLLNKIDCLSILSSGALSVVEDIETKPSNKKQETDPESLSSEKKTSSAHSANVDFFIQKVLSDPKHLPLTRFFALHTPPTVKTDSDYIRHLMTEDPNIRIRPKFPYFYSGRGFVDMKEWEKGLVFFSLVIQEAKNRNISIEPEIWFDFALCNFHSGNLEIALEGMRNWQKFQTDSPDEVPSFIRKIIDFGESLEWDTREGNQLRSQRNLAQSILEKGIVILNESFKSKENRISKNLFFRESTRAHLALFRLSSKIEHLNIAFEEQLSSTETDSHEETSHKMAVIREMTQLLLKNRLRFGAPNVKEHLSKIKLFYEKIGSQKLAGINLKNYSEVLQALKLIS